MKPLAYIKKLFCKRRDGESEYWGYMTMKSAAQIAQEQRDYARAQKIYPFYLQVGESKTVNRKLPK